MVCGGFDATPNPSLRFTLYNPPTGGGGEGGPIFPIYYWPSYIICPADLTLSNTDLIHK